MICIKQKMRQPPPDFPVCPKQFWARGQGAKGCFQDFKSLLKHWYEDWNSSSMTGLGLREIYFLGIKNHLNPACKSVWSMFIPRLRKQLRFGLRQWTLKFVSLIVSWKNCRNYRAAGMVKWYHKSLPSLRCGFDSRYPLQKKSYLNYFCESFQILVTSDTTGWTCVFNTKMCQISALG